MQCNATSQIGMQSLCPVHLWLLHPELLQRVDCPIVLQPSPSLVPRSEIRQLSIAAAAACLFTPAESLCVPLNEVERLQSRSGFCIELVLLGRSYGRHASTGDTSDAWDTSEEHAMMAKAEKQDSVSHWQSSCHVDERQLTKMA